jgi:DNA-binding transcriptional ArsR family regulator
MTKSISLMQLKDELLDRLQKPRPPEEVIVVLSAKGNRELLGLIGREKPKSVSTLSNLADRAQPNVSRALSALIGSGLVRITREGKRSVPELTQLGIEKANELGLLETKQAVLTENLEEPVSDSLFSLDFGSESSPPHGKELAVRGGFVVWFWSARQERVPAKFNGDLAGLSSHLLSHWWRMLYRRDAPFKISDLSFCDRNIERTLSFLVRSSGHRIEPITRSHEGGLGVIDGQHRQIALPVFEEDLLSNFLRPVTKRLVSRVGSGRQLQSLLARIEDSRSFPNDLVFCRTAGALGVSPYDQSKKMIERISKLVELMPDEAARLDFASAVLAEELDQAEAWASHEIEKYKERNNLAGLDTIRGYCEKISFNQHAKPWQRGCAAARAARAGLKVNSDISLGRVDTLSKTFGGTGDFAKSETAPGSLRGFLSRMKDGPTIVIENEGPNSPFILARAIGDYLVFGSTQSCVADLYTDRQAAGRAFAAEFLAPMDAVVSMIEEEDLSPAKVARHFGVSIEVVHHQYTNYLRH